MRALYRKIRGRYRYSTILLRQLIATDFRLRYQNSVLGYLWSLLRPLALFVILYVVFVRFLKVGQDTPHFPVYLLFGLVLWNYFVEVTLGGVSSIVNRGDILRKINFPKYVIVLAGSLSALINLMFNLIIVAGFMLISGVEFSWRVILAIPLLGELFVFSIAVAFFLSAAFVRFRDVSYIWEVFIQGALYATPVLYPLSKIPEWASKLLLLNPVAQIIQDARTVVVTNKSGTIASVYHNSYMRLIPLGIVVATAIVGATYFRSRSRYFAEDV